MPAQGRRLKPLSATPIATDRLLWSAAGRERQRLIEEGLAYDDAGAVALGAPRNPRLMAVNR